MLGDALSREGPAWVSFEERRYIGHRPKKLHRLIPKRQKALPLVKSSRSLVLCIHHDGEGCDLAASSATERIGEQETAIAFALISLVHRKPAQQSRRHEKISRQAAHHIGGKLSELHGCCGQCVIAADRTIGEDKHERRRD